MRGESLCLRLQLCQVPGQLLGCEWGGWGILDFASRSFLIVTKWPKTLGKWAKTPQKIGDAQEWAKRVGNGPKEGWMVCIAMPSRYLPFGGSESLTMARALEVSFRSDILGYWRCLGLAQSFGLDSWLVFGLLYSVWFIVRLCQQHGCASHWLGES